MDTATVLPSSEAGRNASLPAPFNAGSWNGDRAQLLVDTQQRVGRELEGLDAPRCYADRLPAIAARTAFLSPFEFLVVSYYGRDWDTRDALLRLYREDPQQAFRRLLNVWPSQRAELMAGTAAFFDLDTNQIYVNLGVVTPEQAPNVLAHEFWHALANVRLEPRSDGSAERTTGFWTEIRPADGPVWRPVEEDIAGRVPTYLMNEAVAIEMEVAATGLPHPGMRSDLTEAVDTLHDLFALAGRERVLRLYLASSSAELKDLARQASAVEGS